MNALLHKNSHIPFRNSTLTRLLQDYLVNDSKAMMIMNISGVEDEYYQTHQTLKFANQIKKIDGLNKLVKHQ